MASKNTRVCTIKAGVGHTCYCYGWATLPVLIWTNLFTKRGSIINNTRITTNNIILGYVLEKPDISKANRIASSSQQEVSFRHLSQNRAKNHRLRVDISAAVLRWWLFADLCGLWSITAGPNEHKLSYSPSFQSSPVLHCALFQVFGLLCPQSHACHLEWSHPLSPCCVQWRLFEGDRSEAHLGCSCSHL